MLFTKNMKFFRKKQITNYLNLLARSRVTRSTFEMYFDSTVEMFQLLYISYDVVYSRVKWCFSWPRNSRPDCWNMSYDAISDFLTMGGRNCKLHLFILLCLNNSVSQKAMYKKPNTYARDGPQDRDKARDVVIWDHLPSKTRRRPKECGMRLIPSPRHP